MKETNLHRRLLVAFTAAVFVSGASSAANAAEVTLLNVSYDPTRELYVDFNKAFAAHWKARTGDTVIVNVKVKEGERSRIQAYEGVCIARSGGGIQESFTVRKISYGEGVERVFPVYSPNVESIKVVRRGAVRRAKLYYLRDRRGKSARIAERAERREAAE